MRKIVLVLSESLFSAGCAHTRVEQWSGNQMEICGNKWANMQKLKAAAEENGCENARALAGHTLRDGGVNIERNAFNGQVLGVGAKQESCVTFTCAGDLR